MAILDPGYNLTLRPMKYPEFYEMYKNGIRNTWTVDEVDFSDDLKDLRGKLSAPEDVSAGKRCLLGMPHVLVDDEVVATFVGKR